MRVWLMRRRLATRSESEPFPPGYSSAARMRFRWLVPRRRNYLRMNVLLCSGRGVATLSPAFQPLCRRGAVYRSIEKSLLPGGTKMPLPDSYMNVLKGELARLTSMLEPLESGSLKLSERRSGDESQDTTQAQIEHLKRTIEIYKEIIERGGA